MPFVPITIPSVTDNTSNQSQGNINVFTMTLKNHDVTTEITAAQIADAVYGETATPELEVGIAANSGDPGWWDGSSGVIPGTQAAMQNSYMDSLALGVLGMSDNTPDIFSNTAVVKSQYTTQMQTNVTYIKNFVSSNGAASAKLIAQSVFYYAPERFKLFVPTGTLPATHITTGDVATAFIATTANVYDMTQSGVGGGVGGKAVVTMNPDGNVTAITMSDASNVTTTYVDTLDITIAGSSGSLTIPAAALTPFRLALINGSFADATGDTVLVPLVTGDTLLVRCAVGAPVGQKEDDGSTAADVNYSTNLEFIMS